MAADTKRIHRITSFDRFKEEFNSRAFSFVTYDTWEDPSEGPVLRALEHDEGRSRILGWLSKNFRSADPPEMWLGVLGHFRKSVHMQSWSGENESSLMWDAYGHAGRAIRISTSREKIALIGGVRAHRVTYEMISLKKELGRIFKNDKVHVEQMFLRKMPIYRHEKELRLVTDIDLSWLEKSQLPYGVPPSAVKESAQGLVEQGAMTIDGLNETVAAWIKKSCVKSISFAHVENCIESVLVGPRASDEFVDQVKVFCAENGIEFAGKSKMLKFVLPKT